MYIALWSQTCRGTEQTRPPPVTTGGNPEGSGANKRPVKVLSVDEDLDRAGFVSINNEEDVEMPGA
jgi:hypothetical protein